MLHLGDITKIKGCATPVVDCVIGGSPCQDLSVAGKRAGLAGERSGLYMEQIRIIKEMRHNDELRGRTGESIRPRYMVWENVPGAFSSNQGKDFAAVLEEAIKVVEQEAPNVPVPEKGWPTSGCIMGDTWSIAWRVLDAQFWGVPQRRRRIALVADFGGKSAPEILFIRKCMSGDLDESESARKATAGDAESGSGADDRYVAYGFDMYNQQSTGEVSRTLKTPVGGDDIPVCYYSVENHPADSRVDIDGSGKVQTLTSRMGTGGGNVQMVMEPITLEPGIAAREGGHIYEGVSGTLRAKAGDNQMAVVDPVYYIVRRLTPLECERLQGYPDGWTDIGEWVDSKGKKHKEADSPRYKALGNSIAIPPWKWVLKRLCACYERDATMASLFDGIGGFPYIWEQLNGKGSCLWASEIEEFPMAVTKVRFGE